MGRKMTWEALVKFLLALGLGLAGVASPRLVGAVYAQVTTTTVADTVYHADGTAAAGTVIVNWPTFTTMAGEVIQGGSQAVTIGGGGALSVSLVPNVGSTPMGSYYTVVYHLDDGSVTREYWVIPVSSASVTVAMVKNTVLPTSVAMQTVSKSYVDTAIAVAVTGHPLDSSPYVVKTGDTMTGPLVLPADPVSANQAADKHYVDASVAGVSGGAGQKVALNPTGNQVVTQPAGTDLEVSRLDGIENSTQYAVTANVDGIANALQSTDCAGASAAGLGCVVNVAPTVTGQENYIASGLGDQTHLVDMRLGQQTDTYRNPKNPADPSNEVGQQINVTTTDSTQQIAQATGREEVQSVALQVSHNALTGGSNLYPQEIESPPYFKTNYVAEDLLGNYNTGGQHILEQMRTNCFAVGDCLIGSQFLFSSGGYRDNSDEGAHPYDIEVHEDPNVFQGTCTTGCTAGSQSLMVASTTGGGTQGDGRFLIDKNPAGVITTGTLTGGNPSSFHPTATFSGSGFAVSTFFQTAALLPSQAHNVAPGTVTVAIATAGVPAGYSTNTAAAPSGTGTACLAAPSTSFPNYEMAPYTVVDGTHLQMTLLKPHGAGTTIAIGGLCGYGLEQTVDTVGAIRQVFPVIGSYSATALYYVGAMTPVVGVPGASSAYANVNLSIVSAARSSNVVTLTTTGYGFDVNGLTMTVAGVADSSYNGSFVVTSTSGTTLTYTQTGANSTSSGGSVSMVTGGFALYPMAEVVGVYNAATKKVDGLFTLAPNTVAWAANDALEQPHYFQIKVNGDLTILDQVMPRPAEAQSVGYQFNDNNGPGLRGFQIENTTPASNYYGNGGTHGYPDYAYESSGIWNFVLDAQAGEQAAIRLHCNSKGCNRWNSAYYLFQLDSSAGVDTIQYQPNTSTMVIGMRGAGYSFSPLAFTANTANITTLNVGTVNMGASVSTSVATGALTATSVTSSGALSGSTLTAGTISAASETLTGTATSAAVNTGVVTATTLNGAVSAANVTSGTLAAGRLPVMVGSGGSHAVGAVPDPGATAGTTRYLREDGSWVSPGGGVTSFNGRTGVVAAASGDYSVAQVTGAAPLASPALTGVPTAATASPLTSTTQLATNAYVDAAALVVKNASVANTSTGVVAALGFNPGAAPAVPSTGLLALYRYTEKTGTVLNDYSGNGNNGSITSAPTMNGIGYTFTTATQNINLPAALNSANSYYFVLNLPALTSGQFNVPFVWILSSTQSSTAGMEVATAQNSSLYYGGAYGLTVRRTDGTYLNGPGDLYAGTHIITVVCNAAASPSYYIDAQPTTLIGSGTVSCNGIQTAGNFKFGPAVNPALSPISLTYYGAAFYSTVDSAAQVQTTVTALRSQAIQQGVAFGVVPYASPKPNAIYVGNSITCGVNATGGTVCGFGTTATNGYPGLLTSILTGYNVLNFGIPGVAVQQSVASAPSVYAQSCLSNSGRSYASLMNGTNNFGFSGVTPAQVSAVQAGFVSMMKQAGCRTVLMGEISRGGTAANSIAWDTDIQNINAIERSVWKSQGWDVFVDVGADPTMGRAGSYSNATYFNSSDLTHPTNAGYVVLKNAALTGQMWLDGSQPGAMNQTPVTAASYTMTASDGGLMFNTTANSITATLNSALWQTGREIRVCNVTTTGTNTLTLTAPSDLPFGNVAGATTITLANGACKTFQAAYNGGAGFGDFWLPLN